MNFCSLLIVLLVQLKSAQSVIVGDGIQTTVSPGGLTTTGDVITLDNNQFVVAWDGNLDGVYATVYNLNTPVNWITFNGTHAGKYPRLARLDSTNIVAVWLGSAVSGIFGRICSVSGCNFNNYQFEIDSGSALNLPRVARLGNYNTSPQRFIVAWQKTSTFPAQDFFIRIYDNAGTAGPIQTVAYGVQSYFGVTSTFYLGNWVWMLAFALSDNLILFRSVAADGTINPQNVGTGIQATDLAVAGSYSGNRCGLAWASSGNFLQVTSFTPEGVQGLTTKVNTRTDSQSLSLSPVPMDKGYNGWIVGWQNSDGDGYGVFGNIVYEDKSKYFWDDVQFSDSTVGSQDAIAVAGFNNSNPYQVVGFWRSGTTAVFKILNAPSPSASPSRTPSPSISTSPSLSPSASPSSSPSVSPSPSPASSSATPSTSPSTTATPSTSASASLVPSVSPTPSPAMSPSSSSSSFPAGSMPPSTFPSSSQSAVPSSSPLPSSTPTSSLPPTSSSTPSAPPSRSSSPESQISGSSKRKSSSQNVIIGASVGGAGAVAIIGIAAFLIKRKKKTKPEPQQIDLTPVNPQYEDSHYQVITDAASVRTSHRANWRISQTDYHIKYSEIAMDKEVGRGAFGVVWKGKWRSNTVAVKRMLVDQMNETQMEDFIQEMALMKALRPSPFVVLLLGACDDPLCVVTEFCEGGSLLTLLRSSTPMDWPLIKKIITGIAKGMLHLHAEGVVHRDLAARNVLLTANNEPKISDFGLSRFVAGQDSGKTTSDVGPLKWMAPENIRDRTYSKASDVWAYGITLIEIFTRTDPYPTMDGISVVARVSTGELVPAVPGNVPENLAAVMKTFFAYDGEKRPDFQAICDHLESL